MFPLRESVSQYNVMPFNGHLYCCSRFEVYLFPTAKEGRIALYLKHCQLYWCSRFEVYLFHTTKERKALLHQKYTLSIPFKLYLECTAIHAVHQGYTGSILIISNCWYRILRVYWKYTSLSKFFVRVEPLFKINLSAQYAHKSMTV